MSLVSIRGAITVEENTRESILEATEEMLQEIVTGNELKLSEIIQIHFTATKDLDAVYPAVAARKLGITEAALMCMQEMYVAGSLEKCIRCDVLVDMPHLSRQNIKHCYLKKAAGLRPDLVKES